MSQTYTITSETTTEVKETPELVVPWDIPDPPTFNDKHEERRHLKGRLALAFRIFAALGYDEGVAGHITVKVCKHSLLRPPKRLFMD